LDGEEDESHLFMCIDFDIIEFGRESL